MNMFLLSFQTMLSNIEEILDYEISIWTLTVMYVIWKKRAYPNLTVLYSETSFIGLHSYGTACHATLELFQVPILSNLR